MTNLSALFNPSRAREQPHTHTFIHVHTPITHTCTYTQTLTHAYALTLIHMPTYMLTQIHILLTQAPIDTCAYILTHMHTDTHTLQSFLSARPWTNPSLYTTQSQSPDEEFSSF